MSRINGPTVVSGLLGTVAFSCGVYSYLEPFKMVSVYGIAPPPTSTETVSSSNALAAFVQSKGGREIPLGLVYFGLLYVGGGSRPAAVLAAGHALTAALDAVVVGKRGDGRKTLHHWGTAAVVGAAAVYLWVSGEGASRDELEILGRQVLRA